MPITERTLGHLVVAIVGALLLLDVTLTIITAVEKPSTSTAGHLPGGLFANPFLLALVAAILVAGVPLFVRWFVKTNLRSWKAMAGGAKSHLISDLLYLPIVVAPTLVAIFAAWFVLSPWIAELPALITSIVVGAAVFALTLFPFIVLMGRVHERYSKSTLDTLVPLGYQWSWASFKSLYKGIIENALRRFRRRKRH